MKKWGAKKNTQIGIDWKWVPVIDMGRREGRDEKLRVGLALPVYLVHGVDSRKLDDEEIHDAATDRHRPTQTRKGDIWWLFIISWWITLHYQLMDLLMSKAISCEQWLRFEWHKPSESHKEDVLIRHMVFGVNVNRGPRAMSQLPVFLSRDIDFHFGFLGGDQHLAHLIEKKTQQFRVSATSSG